MLPVSGLRSDRDNVGSVLIDEAARHDRAADRYEAMGDFVNARVSRQHAVALRAAGDAYERRASRARALRADDIADGYATPAPAPPPAAPVTSGLTRWNVAAEALLPQAIA